MRRRQRPTAGAAGGDDLPPPELLDWRTFYRSDEKIPPWKYTGNGPVDEQAFTIRAARAHVRQGEALYAWAAANLDGWGFDSIADQRRLAKIVKTARAAG